MEINDYEDFLEQRRKMIAKKIKDYYFSLSSSKSDKEKNSDYMDIINNGENNYTEFKSSLKWDYENKRADKKNGYIIARAIVSFMNSDGGKLFIGVNDDKEIIGLKNDYKVMQNKNSDGFLLYLDNVINNYIGKEYHQYVIPSIENIRGKDFCVVEVLNSGTPVYVTNNETNKDEFYIRGSASTLFLDSKESNEYIKTHWANI